MATQSYVCNSFKRQLFEGTHDFSDLTPGNFKIALYEDNTADALDASTTAYTTTSEVSNAGTGYTTAGYNLTTAAPTLSGSTVIIDFTSNITIPTANFSADASLVYNTTATNAAVAINWFGATPKTASGGDFVVNFPTPDASNAWLRLT